VLKQGALGLSSADGQGMQQRQHYRPDDHDVTLLLVGVNFHFSGGGQTIGLASAVDGEGKL
jgi:hypothetical protein